MPDIKIILLALPNRQSAISRPFRNQPVNVTICRASGNLGFVTAEISIHNNAGNPVCKWLMKASIPSLATATARAQSQ
tara:strand:- start:5232 stop:5465 length:234 start_codon:yes stop_codon:yes gene_type:complete